ncbi:FtsX-like permease family protein [Actinacidiphila epipremni]|uniref:ABC transporter permease n=1 Tax=Actinacidiphila epipremni TaxID=2053013 RepID=A0ABX0ZGR2_9ACTN|nr:ABC transporter permease [Actinacidiphila epipremni]NJP42011.1 ABC transporter permease [Actinacidiphila epipremni]
MTGFVLLRVRAHRLLLAAALLTVLLTTCVLAALAAYTGAIGDAAVRRTLQHQAADRSTVNVKASLTGKDAAALDRSVRGTLGGAFDGLPTHVTASTRSGPYALPFALRPAGVPKSADPDLTLLATFDRARLTLTAGNWPRPAAKGAGTVEVAVPDAVARALHLAAGRQLTLGDRLGGPPLQVTVTGVYRPADPGSPYWQLDPLGGRGIHTLAFTTYGPLLAAPGTFTSGRVAADEASWQATADFGGASTARIGALEAAVKDATASLGSAQTSTGLPDLLEGLRRSLLVTRSTLLIGALQLVILAGFALLLVAQLLAEERAGETALLRARGGSRGRVARLAAGEALLLALPAAVVAPLLAGPVTRLLAGTGAMARTGVTLGGTGAGGAWLVAGAAALACALAVVLPALRPTAGSRPGRRAGLPGVLQAGADVALLVVAGVAYWQLQRRASGGGALSADRSGGLGIDPVLVAAPALCLLAGTVLVLRLLPPLARLGERRAARGRGLALALAGWQLSRRPRRGSGVALLLVLAVAMGMFAIGQGASWDRSQRDQADFAVGADLRVTGMTTPPFGQAGIFAAVPGLATAAPAGRETLVLPDGKTADALVIDTEKASQAMLLRSDLSGGRSLAQLLEPLRTAPDRQGITLDAAARRVDFTATLTAADSSGARRGAGDEPDHVSAVVVDAEGVPYDFSLGELPPDGRPHTLTLDLATAAGKGAPAGPLRVVRFESSYTVPAGAQDRTLTLSAARVTGPDGTVRALSAPAGSRWQGAADFDDTSLGGLQGAVRPSAEAVRAGGGALLSFSYRTGTFSADTDAFQQSGATVRVGAATPAPPQLAAVATDDYLRAVGAKVGDTVQVQIGNVTSPVRITSAVRALPGTASSLPGPASSSTGSGATDPGAAAGSAAGPAGSGAALLLDLQAVDQVLTAAAALPVQPTEWWLAARPGAAARTAAALRARDDVDTVLDRARTAADLRADPLGAGPQSALPAAVVAAAVLAAVGFAVGAAGAARERRGEFAVLRALGAPRRQLARMLAAEQALLVLVSLAVGLALGAFLTRLITPLIVLTGQAARPVPPLVVELPPTRLAELLAALLAAPVAVLAATAARRGNPATSLRHQPED